MTRMFADVPGAKSDLPFPSISCDKVASPSVECYGIEHDIRVVRCKRG